MTGGDNGMSLDEQLAAWLDGELSPEETAAFEERLAADPALAERAADWRAADSRIAGAFAPLAEQPVDAAMLARLGLAESRPEPAVPVPSPANDNPPWWRRHAWPLGGAIAASLALVAVLGMPQRSDPLSEALDHTASGSVATLADGSTVEPLLTVKSRSGEWCREFRHAGTTALACRKQDGWKTETESKGESTPQGDGYGLAGGQQDPALEAAYDRLGASDPLGGSEEAALIAKNWGDRRE